METLLEQQRRYHEERERIEDSMVKEQMAKKSSNRDQINSDHRLKILLDRYVECSENLLELYEDGDGSRKSELEAMSGPNEFSEFYLRLKNIKEFYRKHPNEISIPMSVEFDEFLKLRENPNEINLVDFTDEEGYGKFLDLNQCFEKYINLKGIVDKIDYLTYLSCFDQLFDIPKDKKLNADYGHYLEALLDYLQDYCGRVKPLLPLPEIMDKVVADFERQWEVGTFQGWPKEAGSVLTKAGAHLDLSAFNSVEELASLGLDRLKSGLVALGLKCGGTLDERANRLWQTKGKSVDEIDPSLFAKSSKKNKSGGGGGGGGKSKDIGRQKELALLEAQVYRLSEILSEQRQATKENVQRKQARTAGERQESDEEVSESESDDEQETDVVYNPKNLPLGWDGKPIPYWLYKLHGLNITYTCEICGNATYKGPKAFQRHFAEWRHAHGMRCLGIPNTAHFANVTSIEDALALWQKLKDEKHKEKFQAANEEEYEDSKGNVVNKKTYEDLKRQGLL
ncbi:splicing factor 3A subunit 3-like [Oppia nitens]|uniref:splicing factor 3A subunit 3-like n=1 Tax=Oppia nitens TaxID=1686743 RepID=UPI0023DBA958|nr:splicing factor 3A subunit 3-like [Oppia nitens]